MYKHSSISIVIPTYTRCKSVVALVDSIIPQMVDEDELLVVDDGSQDDTADVLSKIAGIRLMSNVSNEGMLKTWNKCLTSARNDWICMVHDDDTIAPDALETIRKATALVEKPAIVGHIYNEDSSDNCFRYQIIEPSSWAALNPFPIPSGVTIHRSIVREMGLFDERFQYSADIEYFSRICAKFTSIVIENPRIVSFNLHSENYEYKTWGKIDFLTQLEEIEKCLIQYAGIEGNEASDYFHNKMNAYVSYIMDNAYKSEDKLLLRKFCSEAKKRKYLSKKNLRSARIASVLNWHPKS